ncbi:MAG TPA: calcium/sodium antiporter [Campylobacterales bacterium]|nr:calcium/sodium antiporter [Campylobacterales bacterium]HHC11094.1 calcium/sodium antiporter [Campylobacterales bacterium]HHD80573.1 calcium/sodium antiporter [Campylobacterales bacterium]
MDFVIFILAIASLIWGADFIINQSEKIAIRLHIPEFIIGATLVALGTSLPEMAASIAATINGKTDMAISNVIGSNILNISLVLAIIFLIITNIKSDRDFFAKDSSWALFPVMLFILMGIDGKIDKFDGILLLILMVAYILFLIKQAHGIGIEQIEDIKEDNGFGWIKTITLLLVGFILVIAGAHFTVESASAIAKTFGVSEWIIGIVLISVGTSMPELVVSVLAALKGKTDMAIGNIIGSNLANITMVIGFSALIRDLPIDLTNPLVVFNVSTMVVATIMLIYITANRLYSKPAGISLLILLAIFLKETMDNMFI